VRVPVESFFSCAGLLLSMRRSTMALYKADMVTFIHGVYSDVMEDSGG